MPKEGNESRIETTPARQYRLRRQLFELFQASSRYENLVRQDLAPLWKPCFFERIGEQQPVALTPACVRYRETTNRIVRDSLRLIDLSGQPCDWAVQWLHSDVHRLTSPFRRLPTISSTGHSMAGYEDYPWFEIYVAPNVVNVKISATKLTPEKLDTWTRTKHGRRSTQDEIEYAESIPEDRQIYIENLDSGFSQSSWNELEKHVYEQVEIALQGLKSKFEKQFDRRASTRVTTLQREAKTIDAIFRILCGHEASQSKSGPDSRREMLRIAKDLEISLPPAS